MASSPGLTMGTGPTRGFVHRGGPFSAPLTMSWWECGPGAVIPSLSRASRYQNFYGNPRDFEMLLHISKKHHMSQIKHVPHWPPVLTRGRGRSVLYALVGAVLLGPLQGGALCSCLGAWFPSHRTTQWATVPSHPALYWAPAEGREVRQLSARDLGCHLLGSSPCQASACCCQAAASSLAGRGGVPPSGALCPAAARRGW